MSKSVPTFVGIDVSKDKLDVAVRPVQEQFSASNDDTGIAELRKRLKRHRGALVVIEATGGLEHVVAAGGLRILRIRPTLMQMVLLALIISLPGGRAQEDPPSAAVQADYRVGAGDVLQIRVFGHDDLSLTPIVQPDGNIAIPLLKQVAVAGLSTAEIQRKLTNLLERDFLVDPQVEVSVKDFQSQFAIVVGEVNTPGRVPLHGRTRLIDLLVAAGGFKPSASAEVVITRTEGGFADGETSLRINLGRGGLTPQDEINLQVPIRHGDVVTALGQRFVVVEGEVNRPGRYPTDGSLTISGAIATAGGTTRFAGSKIRLRRVDPDSGTNETIEINMGKIRKGQEEDITLRPNDVLTVTRRKF